MSKLERLQDIGQSIWLDFIRRSFMESGGMQELIDLGVRGVTSNPSIFEKAIAQSDDYDEQLARLVEESKSTREIYEALVIEDIQRACDLFMPVFEASGGGDGYISLEASPSLADDTQATIEEVDHFHSAVDRPNLMIKIPATEAGYPAIEEMISRGVNINITLMFSLEQYDRVAEAYLSGLEAHDAAGGDVSEVASVASFFVSRVDNKIDPLLDEIGETSIRGQIALANAKMAYQRFQETCSGERWQELEEKGARLQRVLYGSTSTKEPTYSDTLYVDNLIGPHTVNTLPRGTIEAFLDHGTVERTIDQDLDEAREALAKLAEVGIDLDQVTDELLEEGLKKFADSFDSLMNSIQTKCEKLKEQTAPATGN